MVRYKNVYWVCQFVKYLLVSNLYAIILLSDPRLILGGRRGGGLTVMADFLDNFHKLAKEIIDKINS